MINRQYTAAPAIDSVVRHIETLSNRHMHGHRQFSYAVQTGYPYPRLVYWYHDLTLTLIARPDLNSFLPQKGSAVRPAVHLTRKSGCIHCTFTERRHRFARRGSHAPSRQENSLVYTLNR